MQIYKYKRPTSVLMHYECYNSLEKNVKCYFVSFLWVYLCSTRDFIDL
jgi:hypothetical protein